MHETIKLWRRDPRSGMWCLARTCDANEAAQWLAIFHADEPATMFKLSKNKPQAVDGLGRRLKATSC